MKFPKISLTWMIIIGLILGIGFGYWKPEWGMALRPLSILFLNLIKSIIAPLIFSTLVVGIAGTGDIKQVGRIGVKSLVYFEIVTTFALFIGLAAVNITKPGETADKALASAHKKEYKDTFIQEAKDFAAEAQASAQRANDYAAQAQAGTSDAANKAAAEAATAAQKASQAAEATAKSITAEELAKPKTFGDIISHLSPASIIQAMAEGDVLQIVIFSVLFALAVTSIGEKALPVVKWCESLADIMFRFTEFVMKFAPIGVAAAMAYTVGHSGLGVLKNLSMLVGTLYGALVAFILLVLLPVALLFKVPIKDFFRAVRQPATIAFATTSSESALPRAMENMQRLGVPRRIVGFVLPTGYSFNLDGTTLYLSLAAIFVAQAAHIHLSWWQQITMLLTLMLTSKGVAGVPRASLVILFGTLNSFNLPVEGVIIILGVDELMDMARTAVNVIGNCLATVVIARWEGAFRNEEWQAEERELEAVTGQKAIVSAPPKQPDGNLWA